MSDELSAARRVLQRLSADAFVKQLTTEEQNALRKALEVYGPIVGTWVVDPRSPMQLTGLGSVSLSWQNFGGQRYVIALHEWKSDGEVRAQAGGA
jgi:hypothetical protein